MFVRALGRSAEEFREHIACAQNDAFVGRPGACNRAEPMEVEPAGAKPVDFKKALLEPAVPLTLLHLSDTHGLHRSIETRDLPEADILVHTGDWSENGTDQEHADFNAWQGRRPLLLGTSARFA